MRPMCPELRLDANACQSKHLFVRNKSLSRQQGRKHSYHKIKKMRAIWNGQVIADSKSTINLEGNTYFPPESVRKEFLTPSETTTTCIWKGKAKYFDIHVSGSINTDSAWTYPKPKLLARKIAAYIAFWHGVEIVK